MSIGVAVILSIGFVLGCATIAFGLIICGHAKKDAMLRCMNRAMCWLKLESANWIKNCTKATMEACEDEE